MAKIPVVFTFDKRIILGAAVSIKSLIDCANPETEYDIYVYHPDIDEKTEVEFKKMTEGTRHNITFEYISKDKFKNAPINKGGSWTEIVYYRLLIPELLPQYDKVIYSDVDVLFKKDLADIFLTDLEGYEAAAVPTCTVESIKTNHPKRYFEENKNKKNYISGFLIFNNKLMREERTVDKFFETIRVFKDRLVYFDMDCFNLTCTKIKDLPMNYCVFESMYEFTDLTRIREYKILTTLYTIDELKQAVEKPAIIHYAGELGKPWQRKWIPDYYQEYIDKIPKYLQKYTFRDIRKKFLSKTKFPNQKYDVGIVNFFNTQNYGACLTAYALQELIRNLGYTCGFVNESKIRNKYKLSFGTLFTNRYLIKFPRFNNLKKVGKLANIFISGSDQVLRPQYLKRKLAQEMFLLKFVPQIVKKIAFSASFGISEKEFCQSNKTVCSEIKKQLATFDNVSIRELEGVNICKNQLNVYAENVLDPVFLLDKTKFEKLAKFSDKKFAGMLVSYVLDNDNSTTLEIAKLANKLGVELVNLSLKNKSFQVVDWLKAFIDAKYIITDSYHGVCFALIFNKPFIAKINTKRGISRFTSLKTIFNLEKQFVTEISEDKVFEEYDIEFVNNTISQKREFGLNYLKKVLQTKPKTFITKACSGCAACANICPKLAIKMTDDFKGFKHPQVDSKLCVDCGLCKKICPLHNSNKIKNYNNKKPDCYALMANDDIRLGKSSSGGAFSVLAENIIKSNGYVVGVVLDNNMAKHIVINSLDEINKLRGSKYVQSDIGACYKEIKALLDNSKLVLFTGTPCQVAGLKAYLQKDYEKLVTVDLVCHGVPSPKVLKKYLRENTNDDKVLDIDFRNKSDGWSNKLRIFIKTDRGEVIKNAAEDEYMQAFLRNYILRKSCFNCPFQQIPRQGDLTIGDFWRVGKYSSKLDDGKGTSLLLINNKKGKTLFEKVKNDFKVKERVPLKYAIKGNKTLIKPTNRNKFVDRFFLSLEGMSLRECVKKYMGKKFNG